MENLLRNASTDGNVEKVKELLENGADVQSVDEYGQTALHCASLKGHTNVVELLLNYGSSINTLDMDGRTAVHLAAMWGHTDAVKLLLPNNANVNHQDRYGWTPLHLAAVRGFTESASALLETGIVDINIKDNIQKTAIQKASRYSHKDLVRLLDSYQQECSHRDIKRVKVDCDSSASAADVNRVLRAGSVDLHITRCVFVGPPGVGKTHIQNLVCGLPLPEKRASTSLVARPIVTTIYCNGDIHNPTKVDSKAMLHFISTKVRECLNKEKCAQLSTSPSAPSMEEVHVNQYSNPHVSLVNEERLMCENELLKCVSQLQTDQSEVLMTMTWMICLDSGGQPEFHRLLPIFMNDVDVAVYVLKLNEKLQEYPTVGWYIDGQLNGSEDSYCHTNESVLLRTIQGLTSMLHPPRLLFVGTHRDLEQECDEKIADKNLQMKRILLPEFKKHLVPYNKKTNDVLFPINSLSSLSEDLMTVHSLRKEIGQKYETITAKLADLYLWLEIKALAEGQHHTVIRKNDCHEIGKKLGLLPDEVDETIQFLTKCKLLYYNDFLPNVVFCDLQSVLLNITNFVKKVHESSNQNSEWLSLSTCGQFSEDMLENGQVNYMFVDGIFSKQQYIELLKHLGVISTISNTPYVIYFMPALLKEASQSHLEEVKRGCIGHAQPIILFYEKGWPTNGTFCTLVARLLSRNDWKVTEKDSAPVCLFSNCIQFSLQDDSVKGSCQVTILDCVQYIELHVYINNIPSVSYEDHHQMYRYICPKVLGIINHSLKNDTANHVVHATFMCPCSKPATVIMRNGTLKCSRDDTVYFVLSDRSKVWQL